MSRRHPSRAVRLLRRLTDAQPFEYLICFMCAFGGLLLLFNGPRPGTIEETLPSLLVTLWGAELAIGGGGTMLGLTLGNGTIERLGLGFLAAAAFVYATVLIRAAPITGMFTILILLGIVAASLLRMWSMKRTVVIVSVEGHDEPDVRP